MARDPIDAFLSFYKFMPAYVGLAPGDITQEEFCDAIFDGASQAGQLWYNTLFMCCVGQAVLTHAIVGIISWGGGAAATMTILFSSSLRT